MKTQTDIVAAKLKERGWISREECLGMYPRIERLAARILDLRNEGWNITGKKEVRDYVYRVHAIPVKQLKLI